MSVPENRSRIGLAKFIQICFLCPSALVIFHQVNQFLSAMTKAQRCISNEDVWSRKCSDICLRSEDTT